MSAAEAPSEPTKDLLQRIDGVLIDVRVGLAAMSHSRLGSNEGNTALRGRGLEGRSL